MILLRANFIYLLAAVPVFSAVYILEHPNHLLSKQVNFDLNDISGFNVDKQVEDWKTHRVARDLSEEVKTDLKQIFSDENLLNLIQKFFKIVLKITETITSYISSKSVKEVIKVLGFPGAEGVATFVGEILKFVNQLTKEVSKSDFIVNKPTKANFWKMLSDSVYLSLKKGLYFNALLLEGAKKAFAESNNTKYDVLDNFELQSKFAKQGLKSFHEYAGQILRGIEKLTSKEPIQKITAFVNVSSLPNAQEISEILGVVMTQLNSICKKIINTKFITEAPSMKNVNKFIVLTLKTIILQSLEGADKILKVILAAIQKAKSLQVDVTVDTKPEFNLKEGIAIEGINNVLYFLANLDMDRVLKLMHDFVSVCGRIALDITNDAGVKTVPDIIRVIGNQLTDISANVASFLIDNSHKLALTAKESKFVKEEPSWVNAQEFLHSAIKDGLKLALESTKQVKNYFDSSIAEIIKVPNIIKDTLSALIPESALSSIQNHVKSLAKGLKALTGSIPSNALRGFINASQLPLAPELADIAQSIMSWVNELATVAIESKFLTEAATVENVILAITEIFKTGVSSGLKLLADILEILESLF